MGIVVAVMSEQHAQAYQVLDSSHRFSVGSLPANNFSITERFVKMY
jgi:hypothetical protein